MGVYEPGQDGGSSTFHADCVGRYFRGGADAEHVLSLDEERTGAAAFRC